MCRCTVLAPMLHRLAMVAMLGHALPARSKLAMVAKTSFWPAVTLESCSAACVDANDISCPFGRECHKLTLMAKAHPELC